ncbi:MAG: hypothetical protein A2Y40_01115 [Candidatus Margulisbacteria bacterium GWF2_35_9]|nr:MAG: hypothetical protein A2Y40_01115 [Candidatus Margulisbacteria bacterium GWF2_35_9]
MLVHLTKKIRLRISYPIWLEIERKPQLELYLPKKQNNIIIPLTPEGYRLRVYNSEDEEPLRRLLNRAGFSFSPIKIKQAISICLPNGCFVVEYEQTKQLVATMMARHLASQLHPFGGRIDWLATDPEHRKLGLANICARSATQRLIQAGYENIWVTTDDHRIGALKIFLSIGFQPALSDALSKRWKNIFEKLHIP